MIRTGDDAASALEWCEHEPAATTTADVAYSTAHRQRLKISQDTSLESSRSDSAGSRRGPTMPSPSIRKILEQTYGELDSASAAMLQAHEGDGVDVVELANAVDDYRKGLEILWQYRDFGVEAWQAVIAFSQQALCDNMNDEETTNRQSIGLRKLAKGYLCNRLLAKDDVEEVMTLLNEHDFDTMLFFSAR